MQPTLFQWTGPWDILIADSGAATSAKQVTSPTTLFEAKNDYQHPTAAEAGLENYRRKRSNPEITSEIDVK